MDNNYTQQILNKLNAMTDNVERMTLESTDIVIELEKLHCESKALNVRIADASSAGNKLQYLIRLKTESARINDRCNALLIQHGKLRARHAEICAEYSQLKLQLVD